MIIVRCVHGILRSMSLPIVIVSPDNMKFIDLLICHAYTLKQIIWKARYTNKCTSANI